MTVSNDYDGVTIPDPSCDLSAGLTVTFTVTDACGNESTCTSTIFLDDTTAPEIGDCPEALVLECGEDYQTAITAWLTAAEADLLATSTDNCGAGSLTVANDYDGVTIPPASCDLSAGLTVTFTVTDICGNESTCTSTIFLDDNTEPEIGDCPADLVLECGEDYQTTISAWLTAAEANLLATSTDDCGAENLTVSNDYDGVTIPDPSCDLECRLDSNLHGNGCLWQ